MSPSLNRISQDRLSGNLPVRGTPADLAPNMQSQSEVIETFEQHHVASDFQRIADTETFQSRAGARVKHNLIKGLFTSPDAHDLSVYDSVNILRAFHKPGEHTLGGRIPDRYLSLVEVVSPIGFWIWPEVKKKETPDLLSLHTTFEESQPMLFNGAVAFAVEEIVGTAAFVKPVVSRAAFKEMIIGAAVDEALLPEQYMREARDEILSVAKDYLNRLMRKNAANLTVVDSALLVDHTRLEEASEARLDLTVHTLKDWSPDSNDTEAPYPLGDFSFTIRRSEEGGVSVSMMQSSAARLLRIARRNTN